MVLKDSLTISREKILHCIFEVLSNNMKSELDKILKINSEMSFEPENGTLHSMALNYQRKQWLLYLLNIKDVTELNEFGEHFVRVFCYSIVSYTYSRDIK